MQRKSGSDYDAFATEWNRTRRRNWAELSFASELLSAKSILDAGCGNGRLVGWLREQGFRGGYLGVDASQELLKFARQNFPTEKFDFADLRDFHAKEKFEAIFCVAVLHHFSAREEQLRVLRNLHESLEEGGRIFLTVWNLWQPRFWSALFKSLLTFKFRDCRIPFGKIARRKLFAFRRRELENLLEQTGFRNVEVFYARHAEKTNCLRGRNLIVVAKK